MTDGQQDEQRRWHEEQMAVLREIGEQLIRVRLCVKRLVDMEKDRIDHENLWRERMQFAFSPTDREG